MKQSLIDDFDSLPEGIQATLTYVIEGMALEYAIKRTNEEIMRKNGIIPFDGSKRS